MRRSSGLGDNAQSEGMTAERNLGRTGARVLPVSLGGEGILRTTGQAKEAVPVILEALRLGVRYCDTAPAYQQSQDYYGEAFRAAGAQARDGVFLASKTHERTRDRALRLLDDSLRRLGTDRLDLWQMHDLRDMRRAGRHVRQGRRAGRRLGGAARRPRALRRADRTPRPRRAAGGDAALSRSTACWSRSTPPIRATGRSSPPSSPRRGARGSAWSA